MDIRPHKLICAIFCAAVTWLPAEGQAPQPRAFVLRGPGANVVALTTAQNFLAVSSGQRSVAIWRLDDVTSTPFILRLPQRLGEQPRAYFPLALSPDARFLALAAPRIESADSQRILAPAQVYVFERRGAQWNDDARRVASLPLPAGASALRYSPDGSFLAIGLRDAQGALFVQSPERGGRTTLAYRLSDQTPIEGCRPYAQQIAFAPAAGGWRAAIAFAPADVRRPPDPFGADTQTGCPPMRAPLLLFSSRDGAISEERAPDLTARLGLSAVAFSPEGDRLAVGMPPADLGVPPQVQLFARQTSGGWASGESAEAIPSTGMVRTGQLTQISALHWSAQGLIGAIWAPILPLGEDIPASIALRWRPQGTDLGEPQWLPLHDDYRTFGIEPAQGRLWVLKQSGVLLTIDFDGAPRSAVAFEPPSFNFQSAFFSTTARIRTPGQWEALTADRFAAGLALSNDGRTVRFTIPERGASREPSREYELRFQDQMLSFGPATGSWTGGQGLAPQDRYLMRTGANARPVALRLRDGHSPADTARMRDIVFSGQVVHDIDASPEFDRRQADFVFAAIEIADDPQGAFALASPRRLCLWRQATRLRCIPTTAGVMRLAANDRFLVTVAADGVMRWYNVVGAAPVLILSAYMERSGAAVAWTPQSNTIAFTPLGDEMAGWLIEEPQRARFSPLAQNGAPANYERTLGVFSDGLTTQTVEACSSTACAGAPAYDAPAHEIPVTDLCVGNVAANCPTEDSTIDIQPTDLLSADAAQGTLRIRNRNVSGPSRFEMQVVGVTPVEEKQADDYVVLPIGAMRTGQAFRVVARTITADNRRGTWRGFNIRWRGANGAQSNRRRLVALAIGSRGIQNGATLHPEANDPEAGAALAAASHLPNLKYSVDDARMWHAYLLAAAANQPTWTVRAAVTDAAQPGDQRTCFDRGSSQATVAGVRACLSNLTALAHDSAPNDVLVLTFSGHGLSFGRDRQALVLDDGLITVDEIARAVAGFRGIRILVFDACRTTAEGEPRAQSSAIYNALRNVLGDDTSYLVVFAAQQGWPGYERELPNALPTNWRHDNVVGMGYLTYASLMILENVARTPGANGLVLLGGPRSLKRLQRLNAIAADDPAAAFWGDHADENSWPQNPEVIGNPAADALCLFYPPGEGQQPCPMFAN